MKIEFTNDDLTEATVRKRTWWPFGKVLEASLRRLAKDHGKQLDHCDAMVSESTVCPGHEWVFTDGTSCECAISRTIENARWNTFQCNKWEQRHQKWSSGWKSKQDLPKAIVHK